MFVISQVAHARLYHRLYAQGLMSQSEWDHRKTEPMHFFGRMTIRPYLDKEWLARGGHVRGCSALASFPVTLPHMPFAQDSLWNKRASPAPPFHVLLSRKRFFHRCRLAKDQVDKTLKHPLALEFTEIMRQQDTEKSKGVAMRWLARGGARPSAAPAPSSHIMSGSTSTIGRVSFFFLCVTGLALTSYARSHLTHPRQETGPRSLSASPATASCSIRAPNSFISLPEPMMASCSSISLSTLAPSMKGW